MNQTKFNGYEALEKLLLNVEKPGRYVGGEYNQIVKPWDAIKTRVALIFPDIYDIGQPNLGLAILYDVLNRQEDILAERAYSPWIDMEAIMRENRTLLYALESKKPIKDFDIVGISLPYEGIFSNTLNILDLAGLPLLSAERTDEHPLIIAGGQAAFNPEPMSDFIDAFVLGEGEEVILELVEKFQAWKASNSARSDLLLSLASIPGVYVPSLYDVDYKEDGTIRQIRARNPLVPPIVKKRLLANLPNAMTNFLVPNVEVVHDRISIEIMRGCTRGCRFCHAGMVNRPRRERSPEDILNAIEQGLNATGYEQVSLLSLSSSDHTRIVEIVKGVYDRFKDKKVAVSLPSLRIASFSVSLMDELKDLRPGGGFTIAPEAATERMRAIINKPLPEAELMDTVRAIFEHGWLSLKLYFMIGLPGETMEDVQAIIDLSKKIYYEARRIVGNRARIHVGVSSFIPKPHTPFQWHPADSQEILDQKINLLRDGFRKSPIKMTFTSSRETLLESWLTCGDRRLGKVILQAWKNGAKFDAWSEKLNLQAWLDAFESVGLSPDFYNHRKRALEEVLPWDHLSTGVNKNFLVQDHKWSLVGKIRPYCDEHCYGCGITTQFSDVRQSSADTIWGCP